MIRPAKCIMAAKRDAKNIAAEKPGRIDNSFSSLRVNEGHAPVATSGSGQRDAQKCQSPAISFIL